MSNSARILVIDDDQEILSTFSAVLKDAGYEVDTAEDGRDAIEKSNTNFYNLALIDIRLPDMEGTKLLTALRETTPKMIKIIVTGYPSLQNAVVAVNKGADGYIIKPAKMEELLNTIGEHLRKQREAREYGLKKVEEFVNTRVDELMRQTSSERIQDST
jgi:DNA-binding response OmpR family regulator